MDVGNIVPWPWVWFGVGVGVSIGFAVSLFVWAAVPWQREKTVKAVRGVWLEALEVISTMDVVSHKLYSDRLKALGEFIVELHEGRGAGDKESEK